MSQINGGSVEFERRVKTGDFEHKHCKVIVTFSIGEGETDTSVLETAGKLAHGKVHELLGLAATPAAAIEPAAKPRGRKTEPAATTQATSTGDAAVVAEPTPPTQSAPVAQPQSPPPAPQADPAAMEDVLTASAAPVTLTEADLVTAVTEHNRKVTNPQAIKALLAEYVNHPQGVRDVPPAVRKAFHDRLLKITKETKPEDVKGLK